MNAITLKRLFNEYRKAEKAADKADQAWEKDPENEDLEKAFDEAYSKQHEAFEKIVNEIVVFTAGQIDHKTAATMLRTQRAAIEDLINRAA